MCEPVTATAIAGSALTTGATAATDDGHGPRGACAQDGIRAPLPLRSLPRPVRLPLEGSGAAERGGVRTLLQPPPRRGGGA